MVKNFNIGQEVYSPNYGKGVVSDIDQKPIMYPLVVTFHDGRVIFYTRDGREFIMQEQPSLATI